jgi:putative oxidoreductase
MKLTGFSTDTLILRIIIAIILIVHGAGGMFNGGVNAFGELFLNQIGFDPIGVPLAWFIKISHIVCAILIVVNTYIKPASILTILILTMGIILVHFKEGWFVVGGGRNGIEYNILLIAVLVSILSQKNIKL